jgi:hypothetical protein
LIPISQEESFYVRKTYPDVSIVVINPEHMSRSKGYVMTAIKKALYLIMNTNIKARQELIEILNNEASTIREYLLRLKKTDKNDTKKIERLKKETRLIEIESEIKDIIELGI